MISYDMIWYNIILYYINIVIITTVIVIIITTTIMNIIIISIITTTTIIIIIIIIIIIVIRYRGAWPGPRPVVWTRDAPSGKHGGDSWAEATLVSVPLGGLYRGPCVAYF